MNHLSAPLKGVAFAAILAAVFAVASLAGAELDPSVEEAPEHDEGTAMASHESGEDVHGGDAASLPGLASAEAGYRLVPEQTRFAASDAAELRFRIVGPGGRVVRDFDIEHARRMHLIVVRRDFAGFQHLHPEQRADGTWVADADLGEAGVYRAFADFSTEGQSLTLATDLFAAGRFEPVPLPAPSTSADADAGYEVELRGDEPLAGPRRAARREELAGEARPAGAVDRRTGQDAEREQHVVQLVGVARHGPRLPRDLDDRRGVEPYLDADGHLVALREHDQAFLHTHPEGEPGGRGPIEFGVEYPTAGTYRLFLQFKHDGRVRTAAFTQTVEDSHEAG
jgi:hypothetical protein